ncbi:hypothetical protein [Lysinibacillus sp. BW-2-10]|uniref:hypothetical protein n=1 Tax=Lysinibacillus sp. BW-2-10 TaxID=2590030 RepID=UPI00118014F0|nr:hypothetical protein [Lysinibacillus sp. BW-2-10]TSI07377.1 hypothetical protein FJQ64_08735 [Lysinibacillus sp. BW-2-10]
MGLITVAYNTTVNQLLASIKSIDGSNQTYKIYNDEGGNRVEITDISTLITGDNFYMEVISESGNENCNYFIEVENSAP